MRIVALASGSSGNAILVDDGVTRVLVDCGLGPRIVARHLNASGVRPHEVTAVLVTHEHVDHVCGVAQAVKRWNWSVFCTSGTARGLPAPLRPHASIIRGRFRVGGFDVEVVPVAHDAHEPVAYTITSRASGVRAGIAHDLGIASDRLVAAFRGAQLLCIEANHDPDMLRHGPYPPALKARVAGTRGHLSNAQAAAVIDAVSTRDLEAVVLLHLSQVNNTPQTACATTRRALHRAARRATLAAAIRRSPSPAVGACVSHQLALAI